MRSIFNLYRPFILTLLLIGDFLPAQNQNITPAEYQVKGAFLFNFAQFTDWHPSTLPADGSPFIVAVLGKDPFGEFLPELLKDETIRGHPVVLKHFQHHDDIEQAHLLFVYKDYAVNQDQLRILSAEKQVLTVSDAPDFTERGGIIRFFNENNRVRFEINLKAAEEAKIGFSSKVLRLATICCDKE